MKRLYRICCLFLMMLLMHCARAVAAPEANLLQRLNALNAFHAHFVQTLSSEEEQLIQTQHGEIWLDRPGKIRWEVEGRTPLIIVKQQKVTIVNADLDQVTTQTLSNATAADTPAMLLSARNQRLLSQYTIKQTPGSKSACSKGAQAFELTPKNGRYIKSALLCFQNGQIDALQFIDQLARVTTIQFSEFQMLHKVNSDLFGFVVPSGYSVANLDTP